MPTFASRLFGSSPFAAPGGVVPSPAPSDLPADLDAAIAARFAADATLSSLTATLYNGAAADAATLPYVVFSQVALKVRGNAVGRVEELHYRFQYHARTVAKAEAIGRAIVAAYHLQPLTFADGYLIAATWTGGSTIPDHRRGKDNERAWNRALWFSFTVGRQAP